MLQYSLVESLEAQEYEELMNKGYRKFGAAFFKPVCSACNQCRPLRVPVARFKPDRSQRRAWKKNSALQVRISPPQADRRHLDLYERYHAAQNERKGWPLNPVSRDEYISSFVMNPVPSIELSFWEDDLLRAVVLTDVTPNVVSGIYHYHDPELLNRGVGTYCMLHTIELARRLGKTWAYFGYYVKGCGSLAYKARFTPCETMGEDGVWREMSCEPE